MNANNILREINLSTFLFLNNLGRIVNTSTTLKLIFSVLCLTLFSESYFLYSYDQIRSQYYQYILFLVKI
jgi:hypothetical protein